MRETPEPVQQRRRRRTKRDTHRGDSNRLPPLIRHQDGNGSQFVPGPGVSRRDFKVWPIPHECEPTDYRSKATRDRAYDPENKS
jgi:hypothetical protein